MFLVVLPVQVRKQVFCLFEGMRDVALSDAKPLSKQRRDEISIRIIADNQVRAASDLRQERLLRFTGESLQIRPDFESGDPVRNYLSLAVSERHAEDFCILRSNDRFDRLITGCMSRLGNQTRDDKNFRLEFQSLVIQTTLHFLFKETDLV